MSLFHNSWMSLFAYILIIEYGSAAVIDSSLLFKKAVSDQSPRIAVLGDSYGSGLAYLDSNRYKDTNDDGCYRWKEAYAAQLEADGDNFLRPVDMQFVACTGSLLRNMALETPQIPKVQGELDLIVLTIGGNDAKFYDVASSCIFHDKFPHDYGALYPDETGECFKAIEDARTYINSKQQENLQSLDFDLRETYEGLLKSDAYKTLPHTYHTGYIHFFSEDKEDDWCETSQESFNAYPVLQSKQILTNDLRSKINSLVEDFNNVLKTVTADYADKKFSYVEISDRFQGHRYCERGSNHFNQYYDNNVWLWNVSPPLADGINLDAGTNQPLDFPDQLKKIYNTGLWNTTTTENRDFFAQSGQTGAGWTLRPMHPKKDGYTAIKDAIVDKMKQDGIVGVKQ